MPFLIGGAGGGGATALSQLTDVELTNLQANEILEYDGTKWKNITKNIQWGGISGGILNQSDLITYINNQTAGGVTYRGVMPIPANMTTNTTGNDYADSSDSYIVGDMFIAGSSGVLTVSDGTINITQGDALIVNTDTTDATITIAMIDDIASTDSVQSVHGRSGVVVSANGDYTASQVTNTPAGNIAAVTVQSAINELDTEKVAVNTLTTKGDIYVRNTNSIARLPVGSNGSILTSNSSVTNGVEWKPVPVSYSIYRLISSNSSNISDGDHCPFNTTRVDIDPSNLQTLGASAYTTSSGVNCIGRVQLDSGYYYKITGYVASTGPALYFGFAIFDVTSSATQIGTYGSGFSASDQDLNSDSVPSFAVLQANTDRIIELRKTGGTVQQWYSGNSNLSECFLMVEVLGRI